MFKLIFYFKTITIYRQKIVRVAFFMAHHLQYSNFVTPHHTKLNLTNATLSQKNKK